MKNIRAGSFVCAMTSWSEDEVGNHDGLTVTGKKLWDNRGAELLVLHHAARLTNTRSKKVPYLNKNSLDLNKHFCCLSNW